MALQAPVVSSSTPAAPAVESHGQKPAGKRPRVTKASHHATKAVHGGQEPCPLTGSITTPIFQTTTFVQDGVGGSKGYSYSRCGNPTVAALEKALGALEDAPPAVAYSTGIGAVAGLFFALLKSSDHVVVGDVIYGGTTRLLQQILTPLGVRATWVDTSDPAAVARAIERGTKLVLIETPGNPTLKLTDVAAIAKVTRAAGVPLAVDNTFFTATLLRPLDLGADISVYSTTKYIEGHNATVGGAVVTRDEALLERLRFVRKSLGGIQLPLEAWLTLRGIKTLPLRIERHCRSAQQIAEWLEQHPAVSRVLYPGLKSFPQAELARKLHTGGLHGGIITFELHGGTDAALTFVKNVSLCSLAENLGAAETLLTHPATMTHGDVPRAQREAAGISDGLVRLSVGLEDPDDIIADLREALATVG
ncbi:MAG TPA: PLP-dependent aspartate aminotransferase family protein [Phycisphaerales bacterium]|nr:PLP-dependent aspartate aminotransferase family protein [Phycisphaerales bacterium]